MNHHKDCNSDGCAGCCGKQEVRLSEAEKDFLTLLAQTPFLPITRFLMKSSKSDHLESVALAPVFLYGRCDSLTKVKETGRLIDRLAHHQIISLDYDISLENGGYNDYRQSEVFALFSETLEAGKANPDFLFDTPEIQFGSIALTGIGQDALESIR